MCLLPNDPWSVARRFDKITRAESRRAARKCLATADDLYQEGMLWLVANAARVLAGTTAPPEAVIRLKLRDHYRRFTKPGPGPESLPPDFDAVAPDDDEAGAFDPGCVSRLEGGLAKLTPRQRLAVTLRYGLDGSGERSIREVAAEMACRRQAVQLLLRKAVHHLRKEFPDLI
jgi:DNA-directed RNA polymerase specialized sigma24 family protein